MTDPQAESYAFSIRLDGTGYGYGDGYGDRGHDVVTDTGREAGDGPY